jgi:hypothetical protein
VIIGLKYGVMNLSYDVLATFDKLATYNNADTGVADLESLRVQVYDVLDLVDEPIGEGEVSRLMPIE